MSGALDGLRVLDLSRVLMGPFATRLRGCSSYFGGRLVGIKRENIER